MQRLFQARSMKKTWDFGLSLGFLVFVFTFFSYFIEVIESRPGVILHDPFLKMIEPRDLTWFIFFLIYLCIALCVASVRKDPYHLTLGLKAYGIMLLFRMLTLWLTPLDPPPQMILLIDPVVEIIGTGGRTLTRDLFFSGHTSTLFLLFLAVPNKRLKYFCLLSCFIVASCVLHQHVHYVIDVLAAPFFALGAFTIAKNFQNRIFENTAQMPQRN